MSGNDKGKKETKAKNKNKIYILIFVVFFRIRSLSFSLLPFSSLERCFFFFNRRFERIVMVV